MTESSSARPPQVTMAGWVTIVGSVFVVFNLFETVANLRSLETRERVERMLSEPPMEGTGMTLDGWLSVIHVVSLVGAACAVSAGILGVYVLRRSTSARIGLTVVAVPLFLTGLVTSGFMSTLVAVMVLMLWTRPARDWFAGRPWVPQTMPSRHDRNDHGHREDRGGLDDPSSAQPPTPQQAPWEQAPPPKVSEGDRQPWGPVPDRPVPSTGNARPHAGFGSVSERPVVPAGRPPALVTACALTWVVAGLVALGCIIGVIALLLEPALFEQEYAGQDFADAGFTVEEARRAAVGAFAVFGGWALVALVLAVFAFLGREWARITLVVSASSASMLLLLSAVSAGLMGLLLVLPMIACVATVVLLLRPEVSAWVRARGVR